MKKLVLAKEVAVGVSGVVKALGLSGEDNPVKVLQDAWKGSKTSPFFVVALIDGKPFSMFLNGFCDLALSLSAKQYFRVSPYSLGAREKKSLMDTIWYGELPSSKELSLKSTSAMQNPLIKAVGLGQEVTLLWFSSEGAIMGAYPQFREMCKASRSKVEVHISSFESWGDAILGV